MTGPTLTRYQILEELGAGDGRRRPWTTLIEDFLAELNDRDASFGRGRCSERLAGTQAYLPILEALQSLLDGPGGSHWAGLMRTVAPT
jgi:hypothetical protein